MTTKSSHARFFFVKINFAKRLKNEYLYFVTFLYLDNFYIQCDINRSTAITRENTIKKIPYIRKNIY